MSGKPSVELGVIAKALLVSLVLCLVSAAIIYYTGIRETVLPLLGKIILLITVFGAGCSVSRYHNTRGLVRGMTMGLAFFILMLIGTMAFNSELITLKSFFLTLIMVVLAGGLGGILGIGLSEG